MKVIEYTRHAKRRMSLYRIDVKDVNEALSSRTVNGDAKEGHSTLIVNELAYKYKYPLKIVYQIFIDKIIVITTYPLKKEKKSESNL